MTSYPSVDPFRRGHNTVTSYPFSRSEQASLQTRRSKGTDWFSTMIKIRPFRTPWHTFSEVPAQSSGTAGPLAWRFDSFDFASCRRSECLPADPAVLAIIAPVIRNAHKIHQILTRVQSLRNAFELTGFIADHDGLSVLQNCVDIVYHQSGNVRNTVEDEIPIRTNQSRHLHIFVVDTYVIAFPSEPFDDFDHGALAQIVRSLFETEPQNPNAPAVFF